MVKKTCVCTTNEASAGVIWPFMAMNRMPNCPTPMDRPYAARLRHGTAGRLTNSMAGNSAAVKRKAANISGGRCSSPI